MLERCRVRTRGERRGRTVTDRWLHWYSVLKQQKQGQVPAQGMEPASAKLYKGKVKVPGGQLPFYQRFLHWSLSP